MQEQRREQQRRDRVGPVEIPVEPIEPAERERQRSEKCEAQPEEVKRRRIVRTANPDRRADEQREDADARQDEIERGIAARRGRELHGQHLMLAEPQHRVRQALGAGRRLRQRALNVFRRFNGRAIDGNQQVSTANARRHGAAMRSHGGGHDAFGARFPQHAVLQLVPRGAHGDIQRAEAQQDPDQGEKAPAA